MKTNSFIYNTTIVSLFLLCSTTIVQAQDAPYSQSDFAPLYTNPAHTAQMATDFGVGGIYRSQWQLPTVGYSHYGAYFMHRVKKFGWGLLLDQSAAGAQGFKFMQGSLCGRYNQTLSRSTTLSIGATLGFVQHSLNLANQTFDSQYDPSQGFSSSRSSRESLGNSSIAPDLGIGLALRIDTMGRRRWFSETGVALMHLNTPFTGLEQTSESRLPMRFNITERLGLPIGRKTHLLALVEYWQQCEAQQVLLGGGVQYQMNVNTQLLADIRFRLRDASIIRAGIRHKNAAFSVSYDATNSALSAPVRGVGAMEIGVQFFFNAPKLNLDFPTETEPIVIKREPTPESPKTVAANSNGDSDGDGILDRIDRCPNEPGLAVFQGCNDKDKDGIPDFEDACPLLPGVPEQHGCPSRDADVDGDGIIDRLDKCVYLKGPAHLDGCPDTDGDGISDINDECPYLKGTLARKGCPERRMVQDAPNWSEDALTNVAAPTPTYNTDAYLVEFDTDQSIVKPQYFNQLNRLATWLQNHRTAQAVLSGHTDAEGDYAYNDQLSKRRSNAVRDYLLARGVNHAQLQLGAYGETTPKSTNNTISGRARNRRVEIYVLPNGVE